MAEESDRIKDANLLFERLEGEWRGEGRGSFPTIDTFDYRESLIFDRRDDTTLAYQQRTEKRPLNQSDYQTSHWENGFFRILETGEIELINAQSGGRTEVLKGTVEWSDTQITLAFSSKTLSNDERMVATTRVFEIEEERLRYNMSMQTTRVEALKTHLSATLQRVK